MPTALVAVPLSESEPLARALVEKRLAASVNSVNCTSTYRWDGAVQFADEAILVVKTTADRYDDVVELVERRHPYEVVPIERFDESDATPDFVEWRRESVAEK
ncbi:divalent cation tolerance protein [Halomicrobium zhouii]|uniref:Divalent cation tolerance protein n=1 Tax=Halomicrobium zhouii TaxID=767519 RepID=A0A1I6LSW1_9EURY|nr:divalent-cation tolerance protein CutA [Halomicrobium zhouii]SFS06506.1 divalent cation tolerance protein [Halomicrobium zhouii]